MSRMSEDVSQYTSDQHPSGRVDAGIQKNHVVELSCPPQQPCSQVVESTVVHAYVAHSTVVRFYDDTSYGGTSLLI